MFQEFPKCLYQGGVADGDYKIVFDDQSQADASKDGFLPLGETQKEAPKRRGRPPKAE